jgi:hypothetical protein
LTICGALIAFRSTIDIEPTGLIDDQSSVRRIYDNLGRRHEGTVREYNGRLLTLHAQLEAEGASLFASCLTLDGLVFENNGLDIMPLVLGISLVGDITHRITSVSLWIDVSEQASNDLVTSETQTIFLIFL